MSRSLLFAAAIFVFTSSCKKDADTNILNASVVQLYDEGNTVRSDHSGVTVSVEGSNAVVSTTTDSKGAFTIPIDRSLKQFALVFSHPSIGTFKRYYKQDDPGTYEAYQWRDRLHLGAGIISEQLGARTTVTVSDIQADVIADTLRFVVNATAPGYVRIVIQKDLPSISLETVDKDQPYWSYKAAVISGVNTIKICMPCSSHCQQWKKNDRIYFTAYGDAFVSNEYFDQKTGSYVFPNMIQQSTPVASSIVVP